MPFSSKKTTKTTPLDNLDMNELNNFLNEIRPLINKKLNLDRIVTAIAFIKGLEEAENGMRGIIYKINDDLRSVETLEERKKLTVELERIRLNMKANQEEIERRKKIINDEKKKFYKDNKQIIETGKAISIAKKAAEQERLRRLGIKDSASASARALAAMTKNHRQATIRRSSTKKKLTKSQKKQEFSEFRKAVISEKAEKEAKKAKTQQKPVVPPKLASSKSKMVLKSTTGPGITTVLGKSKKKKRGKNKRKGSKKARR